MSHTPNNNKKGLFLNSKSEQFTTIVFSLLNLVHNFNFFSLDVLKLFKIELDADNYQS